MNLWLGWAFVVGAIPLASASSESAWMLLILGKLCFMHDDMQKAARKGNPNTQETV